MDNDSQKRNWLGTVVFTDIVGYSKHSVEQQIDIKEHFNRLISESISDTDESERIIIDTGDGIALCFLGDPEEAIIASMDLRAEVVSQSKSAPIPYQVRTGINLGPVRLVTDINKRFNVLGDGINVAQRVMSFAGPGQVLVSRSFYDVAWCLSDKYSDLFHYYGSRRDKHSREHVLYEILSENLIHQGMEKGEDNESSEPVIEEYTRIIRSRLASDTAPINEANWDQEVLRKVENDLLEFIGPLAKVVVRKEAERALSLEDLQVRITKAVPAGDKRKAYMEKISADDPNNFNNQKTVKLGIEAESVIQDDNLIATSDLHDWDADILALAKSELAKYVGPLAAMLVRKASRRSKTEKELYVLLADEIDDLNDRDKFIRNIRIGKK